MLESLLSRKSRQHLEDDTCWRLFLDCVNAETLSVSHISKCLFTAVAEGRSESYLYACKRTDDKNTSHPTNQNALGVLEFKDSFGEKRKMI